MKRKKGLNAAQRKKRADKIARRALDRAHKSTPEFLKAQALAEASEQCEDFGWDSVSKEGQALLMEEQERLHTQIPGSFHTYGEIQALEKLQLEPCGEDPKSQINLIREILRLARGVILEEEKAQVPWPDRSCFLHPSITARVREIGEELHQVGEEKSNDTGDELLQWFARCDLLSIPRCWHAELNLVWDGVGGWRA